MSYYRTLGLEKEPFSTSPDPDFFYLSREHDSALTNVLIELHLRRGLSVIFGDVGMGKTTLSRKLIQCLKQKDRFLLNIILDPYFTSERLFLFSLLSNFNEDLHKYSSGEPLKSLNVFELKQVLQKFLYDKWFHEKKTVVLIIDEAQKLTKDSLETLRVMLNYETNENKLLQLVLLGQLELASKIKSMSNFTDRISFRYALNPFGISETKDMIRFRMRQAGYAGSSDFFQDDAIELIQKISEGYPRKTTLLCHRLLKRAVMKNLWAVTESLVKEIVREDLNTGWLTTTLN